MLIDYPFFRLGYDESEAHKSLRGGSTASRSRKRGSALMGARVASPAVGNMNAQGSDWHGAVNVPKSWFSGDVLSGSLGTAQSRTKRIYANLNPWI
ncbi:unnamed protein product [Soboliphyme baturini]|uniref:Maltoporin n=1 Tax=Soboliphyme baturini TaxID=241478 RepID=A0A183IS27_9BILA|nr:unnamed protein product [Soboliphyme baturini]